MATRAADDFTTIGNRLRELTEVPTPKRSGSEFDHCAHCPVEPHERCLKTCSVEANAAGVVE